MTVDKTSLDKLAARMRPTARTLLMMVLLLGYRRSHRPPSESCRRLGFSRSEPSPSNHDDRMQAVHRRY